MAALDKLHVPAGPGRTLLLLLALILGAGAIGALGSSVVEREATLALMYVMLVVGLFVFSGNSGILSFGHIGFMAIGAYTAGLLTLPPTMKQVVLADSPTWLQDVAVAPLASVLIGAAAAAAAGLIVSLPLMRLAGLPAALATFAVLNIVFVVANNLEAITGGQAGLSGVPSNTTLGAAVVWAMILTAAAWVFGLTRTGLKLRASREDELAARSVGIGVHAERRAAFVIGAAMSGIAGALYAQFIGSFNAGSFYVSLTFLTVAMLVIGGNRSLSGAVVGSLAVALLSALLIRIEEGATIGGLSLPEISNLRDLALALAMLAILVIRPQGLTGGRELGISATPRTGRSPIPSVRPPPAHPVEGSQMKNLDDRIKAQQVEATPQGSVGRWSSTCQLGHDRRRDEDEK